MRCCNYAVWPLWKLASQPGAHPGGLQPHSAAYWIHLCSFFLFFYWAALCFEFLHILSLSWIRSTVIPCTCFGEIIRNKGERCLKRKSCERVRKNRESREALLSWLRAIFKQTSPVMDVLIIFQCRYVNRAITEETDFKRIQTFKR